MSGKGQDWAATRWRKQAAQKASTERIRRSRAVSTVPRRLRELEARLNGNSTARVNGGLPPPVPRPQPSWASASAEWPDAAGRERSWFAMAVGLEHEPALMEFIGSAAVPPGTVVTIRYGDGRPQETYRVGTAEEMGMTAANAETRAKLCPGCGNYYHATDPVSGASYCPNPSQALCKYARGPQPAPTATAEAKRVFEPYSADAKRLGELEAERDQLRTERDRLTAEVETTKSAAKRMAEDRAQTLKNYESERDRATRVTQDLETTAALLKQVQEKLAHARADGSTIASRLLAEQDKVARLEDGLGAVRSAREADHLDFAKALNSAHDREGDLLKQVTDLKKVVEELTTTQRPSEQHQDGAVAAVKESGKMRSDTTDKLGEIADEFRAIIVDSAARATAAKGVDALVGLARHTLKARGWWPEKLDTGAGKTVAGVLVPATALTLATLFPTVKYAETVKAVAQKGLRAKGQNAVEQLFTFLTPAGLEGFFGDVHKLASGDEGIVLDAELGDNVSELTGERPRASSNVG